MKAHCGTVGVAEGQRWKHCCQERDREKKKQSHSINRTKWVLTAVLKGYHFYHFSFYFNSLEMCETTTWRNSLVDPFHMKASL